MLKIIYPLNFIIFFILFSSSIGFINWCFRGENLLLFLRPFESLSCFLRSLSDWKANYWLRFYLIHLRKVLWWCFSPCQPWVFSTAFCASPWYWSMYGFLNFSQISPVQWIYLQAKPFLMIDFPIFNMFIWRHNRLELRTNTYL